MGIIGITKAEGIRMNQEELKSTIAELERDIALLPEGSITKKKIRGKDYYYHRVTRNGKRVENYVTFEAVPELKDKIDHRKDLEKRLKEYKKLLDPENKSVREEYLDFKATVRTGSRLRAQISMVKDYKNVFVNYANTYAVVRQIKSLCFMDFEELGRQR